MFLGAGQLFVQRGDLSHGLFCFLVCGGFRCGELFVQICDGLAQVLLLAAGGGQVLLRLGELFVQAQQLRGGLRSVLHCRCFCGFKLLVQGGDGQIQGFGFLAGGGQVFLRLFQLRAESGHLRGGLFGVLGRGGFRGVQLLLQSRDLGVQQILLFSGCRSRRFRLFFQISDAFIQCFFFQLQRRCFRLRLFQRFRKGLLLRRVSDCFFFLRNQR